MSAMAKIRKDTAKNARAPEHGQTFIRDEELKGFAIRITATSARSYIWEGRIKHRPRRITLGLCSDLTAAQAREKAKKVRAAVTNGRDPSAERAAERGEPTFADLTKEYFERQAGALAPRTLKGYAKSLNSYVPKG